MSVTSEAFGKNQFGEEVTLFTLTNSQGMTARIMNYGGIIISLGVPDKKGQLADVVLGHETAADYTDTTPYFGCVVGRFANRINQGTFTLDGQTYTLATNNGPNALHGGLRGFDKVVWNADILAGKNAVCMTYKTADGEEGFPGAVSTTMTYTLTEANELKIDYVAESTRNTPFNITNHSYFNLAGHDSGTIGNQTMMINADTFLPTDATAIPLGHVAPLDNSPLDFRQPTPIGERIDAEDEQLRFAGGYDHNFCLNKASENELSLAARVEDPGSGRVMEVYTTEPGVQFYSANSLDGSLKGKNGCSYVRRGGFCLETQHYPDSPNQPTFPDATLRPGTPYRSQTVYRFATR